MNLSQKTLVILLWNMDIGGVQKRVKDLVFYLDKNFPNLKVCLLLKKAYSTPLLAEIQKTNVEIRYFSQSKKRIYFPSIFWLVKEILRANPNVVLTFLDRLSIQMAIVKRLLFWKKMRLVLNEGIHTTNYLKFNEIFFWRYLIKIFYPMADQIIVPTQAIKYDLVKNFKIASQKISIIVHWIKPQKINPCKKIYDFIYIGRLEKEKNVLILPKIIKRLKKRFPKISLVILGKGSLEPKLKLLTSQLNVTRNVLFFGFQKNISEYLAKAKILLLPSLNEGMPNCVLEAAMLKIPSIVYAFKGAKEVVVNRETGFIVNSLKSYLKKNELLLSDEKIRNSLGNNAQKMVMEKMGEKNLSRFINVLIK